MPRLREPKAQEPEKQEVLEGDSPLFENKEDGTVLFEIKEQKVNNDPVKVEPADDDEKLALKKQIEDLQKSERLAKEAAEQAARDREDAIRLARSKEAEQAQTAQAMVESRLDGVNAAIAAASAEAESAQRDFEAASAIGDVRAQAEAQRKMAKAEASIARLEDGKIALEEAKKNPPQTQSQVPDDGLENTNLPHMAKQWLREHPDYLRDPRKNAKLQSLHWDVVDEGHKPFSRDYFESMEVHLGLRDAPRVEADDESDDEAEVRQPARKGPMVSAPVSRSAPGKTVPTRASEVRLTAAQVEAAKMAGVTTAEYAKQLIKLGKLKSDGYEQYGDGQ